jgi:large subunit ribosomal protein L30e
MADADKEDEEAMEEEQAEKAEEAEEAESPEGAEAGAGSQAEEAAEAKKERKKRKVVRRRKTRKERENPLTMALRLAVESGKVDFGGKAGISSAMQGSAKLLVMSNNTPEGIRSKVEGYSKSSGIPLVRFEGSSMELGSVCGKPFPVSVLSVFEEGSSNILELAKKK